MCGIAGIFSLTPVQSQLIKSMCDSIRHRGPDDEGYFTRDNRNGETKFWTARDSTVAGPLISGCGEIAGLLVGHRRLSIIDTTPAGHQPMEYRGMVISYNGEIFNYIELREELKKEGYDFRTESDSEVILAAYCHWGTTCIRHFNGQWAFAIYDPDRMVLFLSRDRFGIRPLHYSKTSNAFVFGSEIKAILASGLVKPEVDEEILGIYRFAGLLNHSNQTFFKGIQSLLPGMNLYLDLRTGNFKTERYYVLPYNDSEEPFDPAKARRHVDDVRELFIDAVRLQLRSDVRVGSCLSGGIDSSSIVCVVNRLLREGKGASVGDTQMTFTASYDDEIDESRYAKIVAGCCNIRSVFAKPQPEQLKEELDKVIWHQDEPFPTTSIYAQYCVIRAASQHVKVLLDGQGGDELFAGYNKYRFLTFARQIATLQFLSAIANAAVTAKMYSVKTALDEFAKGAAYALPADAKVALVSMLKWNRRSKVDFSKLGRQVEVLKRIKLQTQTPSVSRALVNDTIILSIPQLLRYEDRDGLAFSVESRVPFLDHRLVELAHSIPPAYKVRNGWTKWVFRMAMKDILPDEIRWRKDKLGFQTPEEKWYPAITGSKAIDFKSFVIERWLSLTSAR